VDGRWDDGEVEYEPCRPYMSENKHDVRILVLNVHVEKRRRTRFNKEREYEKQQLES
jgi:hypothetical protein